jgi:type II secretory pathway pseudopilin PulG
MRVHSLARHRRESEGGYMLVAVIFLLAAFTLSLSVAVPAISKQIQLDRERETIKRGKQYQRAIQLYYRKFHAYPPTIDSLVKTNNIRFLRKRYADPKTGKDDWQIILFGQNKAPTAMGFFGQPLSGVGPTGASTLAGTGPSGANETPSNSASGSGSGTALNIEASSMFNSSNAAGNSGSPGFAPNAASGQSSFSGPGLNSIHQTFGWAGIIGVSPGSSMESIMVYKKKDRYDQWEFTYDPANDVALMNNSTMVNQPTGASVVGMGSGAYGTGPLAAPNSSPAGTNTPQE